MCGGDTGMLEGDHQAALLAQTLVPMWECCHEVSCAALAVLAAALGVPPRLLLETVLDPTGLTWPPHDLTAFKYSPATAGTALPEHYDMNMLTLQLPSEHGGLQLLRVGDCEATAAAPGDCDWVEGAVMQYAI